MSDSGFPFGARADEVEALEDQEGSAPNRRTLLLAAALSAVVLGGAGMLFLTWGEEPAEMALGVAAAAPVAPAVATPTPSAPAVVPEDFTGDLGRNPFEPLYIAPAAAGADAPTDGAVVDEGEGAVVEPPLGLGDPTGEGEVPPSVPFDGSGLPGPTTEGGTTTGGGSTLQPDDG